MLLLQLIHPTTESYRYRDAFGVGGATPSYHFLLYIHKDLLRKVELKPIVSVPGMFLGHMLILENTRFRQVTHGDNRTRDSGNR